MKDLEEIDKQKARYFYLTGYIDAAWFHCVKIIDGEAIVYLKAGDTACITYQQFADPILKEMALIRKTLNMSDCDIRECKGCPDCGASIVQLPDEDLN